MATIRLIWLIFIKYRVSDTWIRMTIEKPKPQDFLRSCLERWVQVEVAGNREVIGILHGYDEHSNIVVNGVTETFYPSEENECVALLTIILILLVILRVISLINVNEWLCVKWSEFGDVISAWNHRINMFYL